MHVYATGSKTVRVVVLISGSWGGVGWGGVGIIATVSMATLHDLHLHFMLRCLIFTCTFMIFTCTSCYAAWFSLALSWSSLALHATLLDFHLHFRDLHLHFMLRCLIFTCTFVIFTCTSCYATWVSLALSWSSLALHATLLDFHLHFHWWFVIGFTQFCHLGSQWGPTFKRWPPHWPLPIYGIVNFGFCSEVQPYHWQAVFKSYETTKLYRDPRRSFCCFSSQIWLEPSDIICLGVWVLAEDLKLRGAIIRDKELIMLPNEQATRWEDGEGGRSEWLRRPAVRNWFSLYN